MLHTFSKAGKIFDLFSVSEPEWGVSEVAHTLAMPKSSVCEVMMSLASQGLLSRTSAGRYRLGWRLVELSHTLQETTDFYAEARVEMKELVKHWGETVHLSVLEGQQIVHVEKLHQVSYVQVLLSHMSMRLPAYCSSVGKVLLASQEWRKVTTPFQNQQLPAFTPKTITTMHDLAHELEQVRIQGYAYDDEEVLPGLCCVSAPIYDSKGRAIAGISFVMPANRFHRQPENYTTAILDAAQRTSKNIGYQVKKQKVSRSGGIISTK